MITFFINDKPTFISYPRNELRKQSNCIILEICVFEKYILTERLFAKAWRSFATCVSSGNNSCKKLVVLSVVLSSVVLSIIFDDSLRVTFFLHFLQPILIYHALNLITLRLHCYIESFYTDKILNQNKKCDC